MVLAILVPFGQLIGSGLMFICEDWGCMSVIITGPMVFVFSIIPLLIGFNFLGLFFNETKIKSQIIAIFTYLFMSFYMITEIIRLGINALNKPVYPRDEIFSFSGQIKIWFLFNYIIVPIFLLLLGLSLIFYNQSIRKSLKNKS